MTSDTHERAVEKKEPWLTIVGVGADGASGLSVRARAAIEGAELVVGSERQLQLVSALLRADRWAWPSPFAEGLERLWSRRGRPTCVLASGDPFFYGIGATLSSRLETGELMYHPAPSSLSLAAARLAWPLQHTDIVSLHGRDLHAVIPALQPGRRVLALSWNEHTPRELSQLLTQRGFGASTLHVLEALGGPDERVRRVRADAFSWGDVAALNLVGIEVVAAAHALTIPLRGSLPDSAFEHDGQITKREVRALTLSALAPRPGERLWDIGAGSGSIAIEWMLSHRDCSAIAVERDPRRCARIRENARALGVPALRVLEAEAPAGLVGLDAPDAIFLGGGTKDPALFEHAYAALAPGGRLVINAVALETEALLARLYAAHGGELVRLSIERAEALGSMSGFVPARAVTQWRVHKP